MKTLKSLLDQNRDWANAIKLKDAQFFSRLSRQQTPEHLWIGCSDSRVPATQLVGLAPGELFVHRNIANLVPAYLPDGEPHGTSAAVEYAVTALKVSHIIVLGHSSCGGVQGCHDMCTGRAPDLEKSSSFVGRWMDILRPGYERVKDITDEAERVARLEREAVLVSVENLMTFPFVKNAVEKNELTLHGLWTDIAEGSLEQFDSNLNDFVRI